MTAQRELAAVGAEKRLLEPVLQQVPVGEPGQRVVVDVVLELFLVAAGLGDVVQHADEMRDVAFGAAHRRDVQLVVEERAVLAVVAQRDAAFLLRREAARAASASSGCSVSSPWRKRQLRPSTSAAV